VIQQARRLKNLQFTTKVLIYVRLSLWEWDVNFWMSSHRPNMERFSEPIDSHSFDSLQWLRFMWNFHRESGLDAVWISSCRTNIERFI
jgi:hypothetical protein